MYRYTEIDRQNYLIFYCRMILIFILNHCLVTQTRAEDDELYKNKLKMCMMCKKKVDFLCCFSENRI